MKRTTIAPLLVLLGICGVTACVDAQDELDLVVEFLDVPQDGTSEPAARFTFEAPDADTYHCQLDDEPMFECDARAFVIPMSSGAHRLSVTASGPAGEKGPVASHEWEVASVFGEDHPELVPTTMTPATVEPNSWRGIFRINCDFAHSSYDDPIVVPGQPGMAHLHRFYGNKGVDAFTTVESLYSNPESSCQGNTVNGSSYWIPALLAPSYDEVSGERLLDPDGEPAWEVVSAVVGDNDVAHEVFYYSAGVDDLESIQSIPPGLRMIAGDASTTPEDAPQSTAVVRWHCQSWESSDGANPHFSASIPECVEPDRLRMDVFFPNCWNGVDLDSDDHKRHMAYPINDGSPAGTHCPDSHPIPLLRPSYHYAYPVLPGNSDPETLSSRGWRLASDPYEVTVDTPGGLSLHGDWFNAWHPEVLQAALDSCVKQGLDCHDGNLANGFRLSGTSPGTQVEPDIINEGHGAHGG